MFWFKATHFAQRLFGIQISYLIICFYISNRIATAAFTDGVLIYHFDLCNRFDIACNCFMQSNLFGKLAFYFLQSRIQNLFYQSRFPAATNTTYQDRKSTRLNSSHSQISYAVFCLKKKKKK